MKLKLIFSMIFSMLMCGTMGLIFAEAPTTPKILFTSSRDGNSEIYMMNPDGSEQVNLTQHRASDISAVWSPTGEQILFVSDRQGTRVRDLYVMDPDGSNVRRVFKKKAKGQRSYPAWSPDGKQFAYQCVDWNFIKGGLYLGTFGEEEAEFIAKYGSPAWSPDGELIAFYSRRDGGGIYVMNADGKRIRRVSHPQDTGGLPSWSPDGKHIAYYVGIAGGGIYIMDVNGRNSRRVTPLNIWSDSPAWSPDGDWIAYDAEIDNPWGNPNVDQNIYIVSIDGGKPRQITKHAWKDRNPAWVPEGFLSVSPTAETQTTFWGKLKQSENAAK